MDEQKTVIEEKTALEEATVSFIYFSMLVSGKYKAFIFPPNIRLDIHSYVTVFLQKRVDELYDLRDHYFEKNGVEKASERTREIGEKMIEVKEQLDKLLGL